MAEAEGGGTKIMRGTLIALSIVAAIVLVAVFWRQLGSFAADGWNYLMDRVPDQGGQQTVVVIYLILAAVMGVLFSKAGHFTAFGIAVALGPLLWFLFWEGFPLLGLDPTWKSSLGVNHMGPSQVVLWAIVGALIITLVFVPLEIWEKFRQRKRRLTTAE